MNSKSYVLITPARDEGQYIERTLVSVCNQSLLPLRWVIVNDGSTDETEKIVSSYLQGHSFIRLINSTRDGQRNFGSKVKAFKEGYRLVADLEYEYIGNLDADISFGTDYFKDLLGEFEKEQLLGLAGGIVQENINGKYFAQKTSLNSVCGSTQIFRRKCYESIGGYIPIKVGGIDTAAEILARANGWIVKTFPEYKVFAHRRVGTGIGRHILKTKFNQGISNYLLGYHPLFQVISSLSRMGESPILFGSVFMITGYFWAFLKKSKKLLPIDTQQYLRSEQINGLKVALLQRNK